MRIFAGWNGHFAQFSESLKARFGGQGETKICEFGLLSQIVA